MTDELATQPASDAAPETTDAPAAPSPAPEPKESSAIEKMQKRIDQLTYRLRETERQQARPESPPPAPEPLKPPTRAEHDYDDDKYQAALIAYTEQVAERKAQELLDKRERDAQETAKKKTFQERMDSYAKSKPGFYEKVGREDLTFFDGPVLKAIQSSEIGPEIAEYLAENEDKGRAIAQLDPFLVAKEIGRIEAQLEAAKAPPPAPPKPSSAPPPVPKIEATDSARAISSTDPESEKLSDAEWVKAENRRLANKRKAKS